MQFQVVIEIPYVFIQAVLFTITVYPTIGYYWSAYKVLWFFYTMFCTLLSSVYLGMLLISLTPNVQVAFILSSFFNQNSNIFSGFMIPASVSLIFKIFLFLSFKSMSHLWNNLVCFGWCSLHSISQSGGFGFIISCLFLGHWMASSPHNMEIFTQR